MPFNFESTLTPTLPSFRSIETFVTLVEQGSTASYFTQITLAGGGPVANTDLVTGVLTVFDEETNVVVNARHNQDILGVSKIGANNVTVSVISGITWAIQALDSVVVDPTGTKKIEYHRAVFKFTTATEVMQHTVRFPVRRAFRTWDGE